MMTGVPASGRRYQKGIPVRNCPMNTEMPASGRHYQAGIANARCKR